MEPQALRPSLMTLDAELKIEIGPENVKNQDEVEFAVFWNHPEGLLLNCPNLKAISSCGHGADSLLSDKKLPEGVSIVCLRSEIVAEWMSEYLLAVVLLKRRKLMEHVTNRGIIKWGIGIRDSGNQVSVLGLGFLGQAAAKVFLRMGFNIGGWSRTNKSKVLSLIPG